MQSLSKNKGLFLITSEGLVVVAQTHDSIYAHNLHFLVAHLLHTCLLHAWHMSVVQFLHFEVAEVRRRFTIELEFVSLGQQTSSARRLRDTVGILPVSSSATLCMNSQQLILLWQTCVKFATCIVSSRGLFFYQSMAVVINLP